MKIKVNGEEQQSTAQTLAALLEELGLVADSVATARNGVFVARSERSGAKLEENDAIEVLSPRQGG